MVCYETRISAFMQSEKKNILRNNIAEGFVLVKIYNILTWKSIREYVIIQ